MCTWAGTIKSMSGHSRSQSCFHSFIVLTADNSCLLQSCVVMSVFLPASACHALVHGLSLCLCSCAYSVIAVSQKVDVHE